MTVVAVVVRSTQFSLLEQDTLAGTPYAGFGLGELPLLVGCLL